jgi:hypothetical protein
MAYGQGNIRDSSVSNNSNPNGSNSVVGYTSVNSNKVKFGNNSGQGVYNMMNNFMVNNLPQTFYNQVNINNVRSGNPPDDQNYSYEINLNAVNKSMGNTSQQPNNFNSRSASNDYENNPKNFYMNKKGGEK